MIKKLISRLVSKETEKKEKGQSIVLIAAAMIGLMAFVGIAVDVGFVFARNTQLQAAVDAAALAGVTEMAGGQISAADNQAFKFLASNRIPIDPTSIDPTSNVTVTFESAANTTVLQATEYAITVTWDVDLFFLKVIGWDNVRVEKSATAAFFPLADIYASRRVEDGALSTSNQAVFGPYICTSYGDPYSPFINNFRPSGYPQGPYTYNYRILIPASYPYSSIRVELFDPDSYNKAENDATVQRTAAAQNPGGLPATANKTCGNNRRDPCLLNTGEETLIGSNGFTIDNVNMFWFMRIDENRGQGTPPGNHNCAVPNSYTEGYNTETRYQLYYYAQSPAGNVQRFDLGRYLGRQDNLHDTDMRWVSPGSPLAFDQTVAVPVEPGSPKDSFTIDLTNDVPNIITEAGSGNRYLYMGISTVNGASENGFEIWAGPPGLEATVPSNVNARNIDVLNTPGIHNSKGVTVFGIGNLPMNSNYGNRVEIPLIYVGPEYAGQSIFISLFDTDSGTQVPIDFYFDSIDKGDWQYSFPHHSQPQPDGVTNRTCSPGSCPNQWVSPSYRVIVPGDLDSCDWQDPDPNDCTPFYGGRLTASYDGGAGDTYQWQVSLQGNPYLVR